MEHLPRIHGVSIEQYASIKAALADEFGLDEVLGAERVPDVQWAKANAGWTDLLASDPDALSVYSRELAVAEDRLHRSVAPLESDPTAWVGFLANFEGSAPSETLARTGLGMPDVSRLTRAWQRRTEGQPELGKKLLELRNKVQKEGAPELFQLTIGPRKLTTSDGTAGGSAASIAADAAGADAAPLGLDEYAALVAELSLAPEQRERILGARGLSPAAFDAMMGAFDRRFREDPLARKDYQHLVAHQKRRLGLRKPGADEPGASQGPSHEPSPAAPLSRPESRATVDVHGAALGSPLPFAPPKRPRRATVAGKTTEVDPLPAGAPLPFSTGIAAESVTRASSKPKSARRGATPTVEVSEKAPKTLPFEKKKRPSTKASSAKKRGATRTVDVGARTPAATLPFGPSKKAPKPAPSKVEQGTLTPEQYGSLCAELGYWPDRHAWILRRYGLTPASKAELDGSYKARMAEDAELKTRWQKATEAYLAWLMAGGKPR